MSDKELRREVKRLRQLVQEIYDDAYEMVDEYYRYRTDDRRERGLYEQGEATMKIIDEYRKKESKP